MFKVGEYVQYKGGDAKLLANTSYKIIEIHRGIDGAYDWDDIILEGQEGKFCEFDFEYPAHNKDKLCGECGRWIFKPKDKP